MKTFQNKILNSVLGWVAISALVSGCDLTSLRSSLSKDSSRSSSSSGSSGSSATNTTPTLPSYGGSGDGYGSGGSSGGYDGQYGQGASQGTLKKGSGKKSDGGYGSGISSDFGGYPSKKQSQQKTSWSDSYPSDYPSQNSSGHHSGSWGDDPWGGDDGYPSYPGNSSGHSHGGYGPGGYDHGGYDAGSYARAQERTGERSNLRNTHAEAATATASASVPASRADSENSTSSTTRRTIGESCSGSHGICLALKYVSYVDGYGDDVESERDAIRDVEYANQIWRDCGIQFQLEDYQNVQPQNYDLRYRTRNYEELNQIRGTFSDENKLLVVATGKWDRSGSLGNTWANAWTNLPGERIYGVVLERTVTNYPQILAHELGHYLSLDHKSDINSLMNPVVARQSVELSRQECQAARWAAKSYWREMMR